MMPSGERRECYRVADLRIEAGARLVFRDGEEIHLPPLSFDLLLQLVRNAPSVVRQEELLHAVWRDVVVEPQTLKQRVKLLRESLGDDSRRPRYIATVRGSGYRLVPRPVPIVSDWSYRLTRRLLHIIEFAGRARGGAAVLTTLAVLALAGAADRDEDRHEAAEARLRVSPGKVWNVPPPPDQGAYSPFEQPTITSSSRLDRIFPR
jgi:DNA-binding winged helix-turn-helix (wHTH) protein